MRAMDQMSGATFAGAVDAMFCLILAPRTKYLEPSTWYQELSTWCQVLRYQVLYSYIFLYIPIYAYYIPKKYPSHIETNMIRGKYSLFLICFPSKTRFR